MRAISCILWILLLSPALWAQGGQQQGTRGSQPANQGQSDPVDQALPEYENVQDEPSDLPEPLTPSQMLINMVGGLLVVLGLVALLSWLARKYLPNQFRPIGKVEDPVKVGQILHLGKGRALYLVMVGGQRLLLGVTDHQISLVKALDEPSFAETMADLGDARTVSELLEEET